MSTSDFDADIIIVGAGPSGLMVGCEAALGGAKVIVLEKRDGPTWSRAGTLAPRVMEIFDGRSRSIHCSPTPACFGPTHRIVA